MERKFYIRLLLVLLLTAAFAYIESAVVIYLRNIYYPEGFHFPLKRHYDLNLTIEVIREFATLVIIFALAAMQGKKFWEGFAYFILVFGVWDILFYLWLKLAIGWPESIFTFDVLFLIPVPWIAPVLAPLLISVWMIAIGGDMARMFAKGYSIRPTLIHWLIVLSGTAVILYSFTSDTEAGFHEKMPLPYKWFLLATSLALYLAAYVLLRKKTVHS